MAKSLNLCQFIGRLGQDPEIRYTANGDAVANLSLACSDDYKDKNGNKVEQTNWIKVVAFGKLAEIIGKYVAKGSQIYISGKQVTRKWQDQQGNDCYSTEIVASDMQMLDSKPSDGQQSAQQRDSNPQRNSQPAQTAAPAGYSDFESDIPFAPLSSLVY